MNVDIGIASLADFQPTTVDGSQRTARSRIEQIVKMAVLADELGLDHLGVGEHHNPDFAVSSPAIVLAAVAQATRRLRLTSSVTNLSALDPVRVYEDFATLDLISGGRAEITAGRSAYPEPFALFGVNPAHYDQLFAEKLQLLLILREHKVISWQGQFRPPLRDAEIMPRAMQQPLPVWIGVGGTPASAERAGRLGLPMMLGYIGGSPAHLAATAEIYRRAGAKAGMSDQLRLGVALHLLASDRQTARASHSYYHDFLRPKYPGGPGFAVTAKHFEAGLQPHGHLMIGTPEDIVDKLKILRDAVKADRIQALVDWGGLPDARVEESVRLLATEIAPAIRAYARRTEPVAA